MHIGETVNAHEETASHSNLLDIEYAGIIVRWRAKPLASRRTCVAKHYRLQHVHSIPREMPQSCWAPQHQLEPESAKDQGDRRVSIEDLRKRGSRSRRGLIFG
jgi:hypothetical protein